MKSESAVLREIGPLLSSDGRYGNAVRPNLGVSIRSLIKRWLAIGGRKIVEVVFIIQGFRQTSSCSRLEAIERALICASLSNSCLSRLF